MTDDRGTDTQIREQLRRHLELQVRTPMKIEDDTALFSGGLIDSMGVLEFVTVLQRMTGVVIRPIDITLDNLDSIDKILTFLGRDGGNGAQPDA